MRLPRYLPWALCCAASLAAQQNPLALPQVRAYAGDPRLEPIPSSPLHLASVTAFSESRELKLRFPPRVNGQQQSNGDGHADLYVFVDGYTGLPIPGQLPVLEAVPFGAAPDVTEIIARNFSAIWEIGIVKMGPGYDPSDLSIRIDSGLELANNPFVEAIYETNIHVNCPVVPAGSTTDPGTPPLEQAWFNGTEVSIVSYDIEDGISHPQVMFKFENAAGQTLPSENAPHLVLSRMPGMPFYSSIWEVWTVVVPDGVPYQSFKSAADIDGANLRIRSANVRLNCPVVAVETAPASGQFQSIPFENFHDLIRSNYSSGIGRFDANALLIDIPAGKRVDFTRNAQGEPTGRVLVDSPFHVQRGFRITEIDVAGAAVVEPEPAGLGTRFPLVASIAGNFVPLIQRFPFATTAQSNWPRVSGPDDTGPRIRISQRELDRAYLDNNPPRLPAAIEANIATFIQNGLMDPEWAPGGKPYVERLALVGRALHEFTWQPEDGVKTIDTTSCVACHQTPTAGAGGRSLYNVVKRSGSRVDGPILDTVNSGSMWGSAAAELIVADRRVRGIAATHPHAATGDRDTIRRFTSKAQVAHFGIQSPENIVEQTRQPIRNVLRMDHDRDGVVEEAMTGEITAQSAYLLGLKAPSELMEPHLMEVNGITEASVENGRRLFRNSITRGGVGCASCHTPFLPLNTLTFPLSNPETTNTLPIPVSYHMATQLDVTEGYAFGIGQAGARIYGDFKFHKMGRPMRSIGSNSPDVLKTAELWDVGSTAPYLRDGSAGMDLRQAILRHSGVSRTDVQVTLGAQTALNATQRQQTITVRNTGTQTIAASATQPIRVVLVGTMLPATATAFNASGTAADGSRRQGAFWNITQPIAPGQSVTVQAVFTSASNVTYTAIVQDWDGFSEAAASTRAFSSLRAADQKAVLDFLKMQTIEGIVGEGGIGVPATEVELPDLGLGG